MEFAEAEGSSIDEAIEKALNQLGTTRDRVEIEILSNTARGLFGLGGRKARIRATVRRPIDVDMTPAAPTASPPPAGARSHLSEEPPTPAAETVTEPAASTSERDQLLERAQTILQEIVKRIGVRADITGTLEDGQVLLELSGDSSGVLIGRRGQMLDALEYLVNRIVSRDEGGSMRIAVDAENYRARRREALESMARRMADEAKRKRRPVTLNPMSPRDRRIVHMVLQEDPGLTTKSSGRGYFRRLVIMPAGTGRPTRDEGERA